MICYGCEVFSPVEGYPSVRAISVHLTRIMRFAGGIVWPVSLHSCVVADLVKSWGRDELEVHALLHDSAECISNDIQKDFKRLIPEISQMEEKIRLNIYRGLDVEPPNSEQSALVKAADVAALRAEMRLCWPRKLRKISETARMGHPEAEALTRRYVEIYASTKPQRADLLESNGKACVMFRRRLWRAIKTHRSQRRRDEEVL